MAETTQQPKRSREDFQSHQDSIPSHSDDSKRHKPYNTILNFLEEEELDPTLEPSQDLTDIFTTLQQELCDHSSTSTTTPVDPPCAAAALDNPAAGSEEDVMRHLLEASDDELGIPNRSEDDSKFELFQSVGDFPHDFGDNGGLWEIEDEAANYYTVLQAEFFM